MDQDHVEPDTELEGAADTPSPEDMTGSAEPAADAREREDERAPSSRATSGFTVHDRRFWALDPEEIDAEEDRPRAPSFVERLQSQLEDKDRQLREYIAAYKTEVVEGLEKTKQRLERDAEAQRDQLRGQLAEPMMEVLDALERSLAAAQDNPDPAALHEGVKMVHLLMIQKLQELGLSRVPAAGQPFDPAIHEAVAVVPVTDPDQDNRVIAELRPGFRLGERLVRAALVQVGRLQS